MIAKQSALVDDLNGQIEQLKSVNSQLDYTWGEKYREATETKDAEYAKLKKDLQGLIDSERRAHNEKVKTLVTDFKQDMQTVESTHKRKTSESTALTVKMEAKVQKQEKVIDELKNLL